MSYHPRRAQVSIAALVLLAGCRTHSAEAIVGPRADFATVASHGSRAVVNAPFRGIWDNTESPPAETPPAGCTIFTETFQVGHATHLGAFRGTGRTCANPQAPPTDTPPIWDHAPAPPYLVAEFTNEMVWTAANGDDLWLRPNDGVFVQSLSSGAASVRGTLRIAGGTGRFENASGEVAVTGGRRPGEPGDHLEFEGWTTMNPGARR